MSWHYTSIQKMASLKSTGELSTFASAATPNATLTECRGILQSFYGSLATLFRRFYANLLAILNVTASCASADDQPFEVCTH